MLEPKSLIQSSALLLGASPTGSALLLSLCSTLLMLLMFRLVEFLGRRLGNRLRQLSPTQREAALVLGLAGLLVGLGDLFLELAHSVLTDPSLTAWDQRLVESAHRHAQDWEVALFRFTTLLGGLQATLILGITVGLYLCFKRYHRYLIFWMLALLGNAVWVQLVKQVVRRDRPVFLEPFLSERNFSFPSGHAASSIILYGTLAFLIWRLARSSRVLKAGALAVLWAGVFIGTSRLVLGVHYPSDVLAGWCLAGVWLLLLILGDRAWRRGLLRRRSVTGGPDAEVAR